jgi:hypothetical protein
MSDIDIGPDGEIRGQPEHFADGRAQWDYFAAFVDGANAACGKKLWAITDGQMFQIKNETDGTETHRFDRASSMNKKVLLFSLIAAIDALPFWKKGPGLGDPFAPDTPLFGDPV